MAYSYCWSLEKGPRADGVQTDEQTFGKDPMADQKLLDRATA